MHQNSTNDNIMNTIQSFADGSVKNYKKTYCNIYSVYHEDLGGLFLC